MAATTKPSTTRTPAVHLCLYVAAGAPNPTTARANLAAALDASVEVTIVDVFESPELALADQVYVTPMLIRISPPPRLRIIGTLRDRAAILQLLEAS